ncbi:MAG: hypothetical protein HPM95_15525 [Alphaproteobacteria bacterium]|nr:hypothetical protein [Alphaproteobacteria bacterium]
MLIIAHSDLLGIVTLNFGCELVVAEHLGDGSSSRPSCSGSSSACRATPCT